MDVQIHFCILQRLSAMIISFFCLSEGPVFTRIKQVSRERIFTYGIVTQRTLTDLCDKTKIEDTIVEADRPWLARRGCWRICSDGWTLSLAASSRLPPLLAAAVLLISTTVPAPLWPLPSCLSPRPSPPALAAAWGCLVRRAGPVTNRPLSPLTYWESVGLDSCHN